MTAIPASPGSSRLSRRRFLAAGGVLAAGAALGAAGCGVTTQTGTSGSTSGAAAVTPTGPRRHFRSRPDLTPPAITVSTTPGQMGSGLVFFTPGNGKGPDGPMIVDGTGEPVWFRPGSGKYAANFRPTTYQGQPVLAWWEGDINGGYGVGQYVLADASYKEIARVGGGKALMADLHEMQVTPEGTALITATNGTFQQDPRTGQKFPWPVWDNIIQEIQIDTGAVLFEWHSRDHIYVDESYLPKPATPDKVYDYLHANSIEVDTDGNLLVSARHTFAVYKIHRTSGEVVWRMGGKRSDFAMAGGSAFAWQHDARRHPDGTLTIFDDEAAPGHSRAIILTVDEEAKRVTLQRAYTHPRKILATSQGNMQVLPNGNLFVGWGANPNYTEFRPDGSLALDASFPASVQSYRSFQFPWVGRPADLPALAVQAGTSGALTAYASWNGATEVAGWRLLGGADASSLASVATAPRAAFETAIPVPAAAAVFAVRALDGSGTVLATSAPVAPTA